jgi:cytoskeletal protein RodZ
MQRMLLRSVAIALLLGSLSYGQSLGDVARENREKKAEDAAAVPSKVITNKDLGKDPAAAEDTSESPASDAAESDAGTTDPAASKKLADRRAADNRAAHRSLQQRMAEQRVADQWKRQIAAQKEKMAMLQSRIEEIQASIRAWSGNVQYDQPYDRSHARQVLQVEQIRQQLEVQRIKLDQMQEAARRAGLHSAVYDP